MCNGNWHGIADLLLRMEETQRLLASPEAVDRPALEASLANLIAIIDWFEWANQLSIDPQRVEAEFDRYDEILDSATTQRESAHS